MDVLNNKFFKLFFAAALILSVTGLASAEATEVYTLEGFTYDNSIAGTAVHEEYELIFYSIDDGGLGEESLVVTDFDGNILWDIDDGGAHYLGSDGQGGEIEVDEENDIFYHNSQLSGGFSYAVEINEPGSGEDIVGSVVKELHQEFPRDTTIGQMELEGNQVFVADANGRYRSWEYESGSLNLLYSDETYNYVEGVTEDNELPSAPVYYDGSIYMMSNEDFIYKIDFQTGQFEDYRDIESEVSSGFARDSAASDNGFMGFTDTASDGGTTFFDSSLQKTGEFTEEGFTPSIHFYLGKFYIGHDNGLGQYLFDGNTLTEEWVLDTERRPGTINTINSLEQIIITDSSFGSDGWAQVLQLPQDPEAELIRPEDGVLVDLNDVLEIEYEADSNDGDTLYELIVEKPDGTTEVLDSRTVLENDVELINADFQPTETGLHEYYVEIEGEEYERRSFEVVDYSPPNLEVTMPEMNEVFLQDSSADSLAVWVRADWSELTISGDVEFLVDKGNNNEWESIGFFTDVGDDWATVQEDFPVDSESRFRASFQDDIETTNDTVTFEVQGVETPVLNNLNTNPEVNNWFADGLDLEFDGETGELNLDRAEVRYCVKDSELTCDQLAETFIMVDETETIQASQFDNVNALFDHVETNFLEYNSNWQEEYLELELTVFDEEDLSSNTLSTTQQIPLAEPVITEFTVTSDEVSDLENVQAGDYFDFTVEGEVNADDIETITYNLDVSNSPNPDPVTVTEEDFFQDGNIFTNNLQDAFQMQEDWEGGLLEFQATAEDVEGRTVESDTVSVQTGTPPNDFLLNSPEDGEFFLIEEGETEREVTIDYGIDSSELSGDLELYVDEEMVESRSVGSNTQESFTYTDSYVEGSYNWYLEWVDETGEVYSSDTRSFEVSQYPVGLSMDSPDDGETIETVEELSSVDHLFTVSSEAFTGDWYYDFELVNGDDTVVADVESTTYSQVEQQFTETVSELEEGSYTWTVEVYDDSDDSLITESSSTYDIDVNPLQEAEIQNPSSNSVYMIPEDQDSRTVSVSYTVTSKESEVNTELFLDGESLETQTVPSGETNDFELETPNLTAGVKELELVTEDGQGRTVNDSVTFEVEEYSEEETVPEIESVTFEPSLTEATVGDEIDVFITGSGVPEDVDNVELQVEFGDQVEIITIQQEDLEEGSWTFAKRAAFTMTRDYIGSQVDVRGIVESVRGDITSFFQRFGTAGSEASMFANLEEPYDTKVITQEDGADNNIEFSGIARAAENDADWELIIEGESLAGGTVEAGERVDVQEFIPPSSWSSEQFGTFDARIQMTDTVTEEVRNSFTNTFTVSEETEDPVLNIRSPRQNEIFRVNPAQQRKDVELDWRTDLNSAGEGQYTINIQDKERDTVTEYTDFTREVSSSEVNEGQSSRNIELPFQRGTYNVEIVFESSDGTYNVAEDRDFEVTEREQTASGTVTLDTPVEGTTLVQSRAFMFKSEAYVNDEALEPVVETRILDSNDEVVQTWSDEIKQGTPTSIQNTWPEDQELGDYTWEAELLDENEETLDLTEQRSFTVQELTTPSIGFNLPGESQVYQEGDEIPFEYDVTAYERDLSSEARIRRAGDFDTLLVAEETMIQVPSGETRSVEASRSDLPPGKYEWFVRSSYNPEFDSQVQTFTIESDDVEDPTVELLNPEQDDVIDYDTEQEFASVDFQALVQVFSESEASVQLLVEDVESSTGYESFDVTSLTETDGETNVSQVVELEESGYRYTFNVTQGGESFVPDSKSFVVNDPETEVPEMPEAEDSQTIIDRVTENLADFLGENGQFMFSILLILAVSSGITMLTTSEKLGLSSMILLALGFSVAGWIPSWIAAVFTLMSVGIAIFLLNTVMNGRGV